MRGGKVCHIKNDPGQTRLIKKINYKGCMKKKVTSRDVAEAAGVSRATVSYVLNNVKEVKIKPDTRKKVLAPAKLS